MPASPPNAEEALLTDVLTILDETYGHEPWVWHPEHVRGPMDIVAGAILVQHTTWTNAERALEQLRSAGALDPATLREMPAEKIEALVRVSGTPTVKARRLRAMADTIVDAGGLDALLSLRQDELRARLLATHGVGPETADAIALYAAHHRAFIIDAYTQRVIGRIGIGPQTHSYDAWQSWFEDGLPHDDVADFQRHHAVIVAHAKTLCRPRPLCQRCPLLARCAYGSSVAGGDQAAPS